jgi:glycosyltransferase involved in cell wall biosynthesis
VGRAIRSVLCQDFDDFELIVVDDGSTDDTPAVVATITDARVRYLRFEQNRGIGAARHDGVMQARGAFVAFIDSDDIWLPGKLGYQTRVVASYPAVDLLFGDYLNVNHLSGTVDNGFRQHRIGLRRLKVAQLEADLFQILAGLPESLLVANFIGPCSGVIVRREVFDRVGSFDPSLSGPEDFEFWWRASLEGVVFAYTTRTLIERHKDSGSITAGPCRFVPHHLEALDLCEQTARRAGRLDLIRHLNVARHRDWRRLVLERASLGRRAVWSAFRHSLHYGASVRAMAYLIAALGGPEMISALRRFKKLLTPPRVV